MENLKEEIAKNTKYIDASRPIKDFDGSIIYNEKNKPHTIGEAVCNILKASRSKFDLYKTLIVGQKFAAGGKVDIDISDLNTLKDTINSCKDGFSHLVLSRIIEAILDAEKETL